MENFSWKTTVAGLIGILTGLGMIGKILAEFANGQLVTYEAVAIAFGSIAGGIGLIFARDNDRTSEDVGAKRW